MCIINKQKIIMTNSKKVKILHAMLFSMYNIHNDHNPEIDINKLINDDLLKYGFNQNEIDKVSNDFFEKTRKYENTDGF